MLYLYYIDKLTGRIKGFAECADRPALKWDIDFKDKSTAVATERPDLNDDDIVVIKDGQEDVYAGICESISTGPPYTLNLLPIENLFDRTIFVGQEAMISETGIEDFIADEISRNFISSGDALFDKPYITVTAETHTPVGAAVSTIVDAENGIYNLKTFLGNALQYYHIRLGFRLSNGGISITIRRDDTPELKLDTDSPDILDVEETYKVDVLAKLCVKWTVRNADESETTTYRTFYLKADRSITEDAAATDRVDGTVSTTYIEAETEAAMLQEVKNTFTSNSYQHAITFKADTDSKIYPPEGLYVGRRVRVKSKHSGLITTSMITKVEDPAGSSVRTYKLGTLPITLIERIRRI